jgi:subtilase family serine protease
MLSNLMRRLTAVSTIAIAASLALPAVSLASNVPPGVRVARDLGVSDPTRLINITVHLKLPNQALFDRTVDALYDRSSPTFHQWLSDAEMQRFAPPASDMAAVRATLESYGLSILSTDKFGFSIRARGTLGNVARAFNTEIHDFQLNGHSFRANVRDAVLSGTAGAYVHAVAGIESHTVRPLATRALNPRTGKAAARFPVASVHARGGLSSIITDEALSAVQKFSFTTPGESLPTAEYSGYVYNKNPDLEISFTPAQLEAAYNLPAAYKAGLTGAGQTIVLLEGYGYPTNETDANAFAKLTGLPALKSTNFKIVYPEGEPVDPNAGVLAGWDIEIALDTDWSHSTAPDAKIVVVATNGQDNEDFQASMTYIIDKSLGYTVSDSWEEDTDVIAGPDEQTSYEDILKTAAAKGISFQFSTGDGGDGGLGTPVGAAGVPSVAPHATAVGGTAILNKPGGSSFFPVGWGDTISFIADDGPIDPPQAEFLGGGGGGESIYWPKPSWQSALPGTGRQTPDISALADPYTGVVIVVTSDGTQYVEPGWGGTSLASPIFSAIWAIADQKAGAPLGQAAPAIAALKTGVTDVLADTSKSDVSGSITDANGTTDYTSTDLFNGYIPDKQPFIDAIWDIEGSPEYVAIAFALDSSLNVTKGWDNATGYGTPQDALAFVDAVAAAAAK